jgi:hypothetical protein
MKRNLLALLMVFAVLLSGCNNQRAEEPAKWHLSLTWEDKTLPAPAQQHDAAPSVSAYVSLNYDETNGDPLTPGQSQLIALYLRIPAPITQTQLETAVSQIQQEAAAANATTFQGSTLKLDQHQAWLVWCSDATQVDPPADVSLVHEITLLDPSTLGRVWIQVPFADGVPIRSDDTWKGCNSQTGFWAVAVH